MSHLIELSAWVEEHAHVALNTLICKVPEDRFRRHSEQQRRPLWVRTSQSESIVHSNCRLFEGRCDGGEILKGGSEVLDNLAGDNLW